MTTIKRFNPDYKMHAARFEAFARETEHGEYVRFDAHQQVVSALEAERDAQQKRADALAVENTGFKHALSVILEHVDVTDKGQAGVVAMIANDELFNSETPATDAALSAIEARFCGLLDNYGKVEPERFNPEFADLYAKIVNRIFSSVLDNPSVTNLESLTDWLENSAENARAYADMSIKFHVELREGRYEFTQPEI